MIRFLRGIAFVVACLACGDEAVAPAGPACGGAGLDLRQMNVFEGATVRGTDLECIRLAGNASYILLPQILGETLPYVYQPFVLGTRDGEVIEQSSAIAPDVSALTARSTHERLHELARRGERGVRQVSRLRAQEAAADAERREFSVLAALAEPLQFTRVQASRRFAGSRILLYVDDRAAAAYTDTELAALGTLYNDVLYPTARGAFGEESDVDGNGRILVLLTPAVNALVDASECATFGFATGFFYGFDLVSATAESNRAEIFYALTPDPSGTYSCPHTKAEVSALLPATFVHELQHMISFGHRVVRLGRSAEVPWLNEGLSHVAEELGALYYEAKYPPPAGRTNPDQLFPDSAAPLVMADVFNSYRYLQSSPQYSVVSCVPGSYCSTPERGGAWLFLRWLRDATGDTKLYERLVQTDRQDRANVAAAAGRSFEDLFGDFAIALWGDSIAGAPRMRTSPMHRFSSRNLRRLYESLYRAVGPLGGIPQSFPITPIEIAMGTLRRSAMRPGSLQAFRLVVPASHPEAALTLTAAGGSALRSDQRAQLSILRVP